MTALLERPVTTPTTEPDELTPAQLIALRALTGWSQARFGEVVGYSQDLISLFELGRRPIPRDLVVNARARVEQRLRQEIAQRQAIIKALRSL